jgi:hypothetical protein
MDPMSEEERSRRRVGALFFYGMLIDQVVTQSPLCSCDKTADVYSTSIRKNPGFKETKRRIPGTFDE